MSFRDTKIQISDPKRIHIENDTIFFIHGHSALPTCKNIRGPVKDINLTRKWFSCLKKHILSRLTCSQLWECNLLSLKTKKLERLISFRKIEILWILSKFDIFFENFKESNGNVVFVTGQWNFEQSEVKSGGTKFFQILL